MEAGTNLDTLVAERVMGWTRIEPVSSEREAAGGFALWKTPVGPRALIPFSHDITRAWEIVEALRGRGMRFLLITYSTIEAQFLADEGSRVAVGRADAAPLAICLAALKVCGVEVDDA